MHKERLPPYIYLPLRPNQEQNAELSSSDPPKEAMIDTLEKSADQTFPKWVGNRLPVKEEKRAMGEIPFLSFIAFWKCLLTLGSKKARAKMEEREGSAGGRH
uniref:Uncharacterized protein n=1 Tax=Tanacetum cinerariifolium TaxID=118510 RepID=A0A699HWH7_TANCI|nr:hypothetical protein [Tanacetum cinerariifolium]